MSLPHHSMMAAKSAHEIQSPIAIVLEDSAVQSAESASVQSTQYPIHRDTVAMLNRLALDETLDPQTVFQQAMAMEVLVEESITSKRTVLLTLHRRMLAQLRLA